MAGESKYGRGERLLRICGIALVVFVAAGLVYLAPLAVLARIEEPSGGRRYLGISINFTTSFSDSPSYLFSAAALRSKEREYWLHSAGDGISKPKTSILDAIYRPILHAAGGDPREQNKFAEFVLGVE